MELNNKISTIAKNIEKVYLSGAEDFGLKAEKDGIMINADYVHPIEHNVEVELKSKNLFRPVGERVAIDPTKTYFLSSGETTKPDEPRCAFYLYDADGNSLGNTYDISFYAFYWAGTRWYLGSNATNLNIKIEFKGTDIDKIAYLEWQLMPFDNVQLEEGIAATPYSPPVADFSEVNVKTIGKNILNLEGREVVNFGAGAATTKRTFFNEKAIILGLAVNNNYQNLNYDFELTKNTISCIASTSSYGLGLDVKIFPNTTYRFSCSERATDTSVRLMEYDIEGNYIKNTTIVSNSVTTTANTAWGVFMFKADTANYEHYILNPQLEYGSIITEYEPYQGTEYTANADGTVDNVKSISPIMNISTDSQDVTINANYYVDSISFANDLKTSIINLGGDL